VGVENEEKEMREILDPSLYALRSSGVERNFLPELLFDHGFRETRRRTAAMTAMARLYRRAAERIKYGEGAFGGRYMSAPMRKSPM
jgi:hypothetical protein